MECQCEAVKIEGITRREEHASSEISDSIEAKFGVIGKVLHVVVESFDNGKHRIEFINLCSFFIKIFDIVFNLFVVFTAAEIHKRFIKILFFQVGLKILIILD